MPTRSATSATDRYCRVRSKCCACSIRCVRKMSRGRRPVRRTTSRWSCRGDRPSSLARLAIVNPLMSRCAAMTACSRARNSRWNGENAARSMLPPFPAWTIDTSKRWVIIPTCGFALNSLEMLMGRRRVRAPGPKGKPTIARAEPIFSWLDPYHVCSREDRRVSTMSDSSIISSEVRMNARDPIRAAWARNEGLVAHPWLCVGCPTCDQCCAARFIVKFSLTS